MSQKSRLFVIALVLIAMVLSACAPAPTATPVPPTKAPAVQPTTAPVVQPTTAPVVQPTTAPATKKPRIVYVFKWALAWPDPIQAALDKREAELGVDWLLTGPQTSDVALQVAMIEDVVSSKADVLVVSSLGPAVCNAVDEAIDAGIKVLMADGDCPDSKREHFVGSNNISLGMDAAKLLKQAMTAKGITGKQKGLVITGTPGAPNLQEREKGFKDGCKELGIDIDFLPTVPCYEDSQKAIDAVETSLRGDQSITVVYSTAWWPFATEAANLPSMVQRVKDGKLVVVGVDAQEPALKLIEEGYIYGLVNQNLGQLAMSPLDMGYDWGIKGNKDYPEICTLLNEPITKDGANGTLKASDYLKKQYVDFAWDLAHKGPADYKPTAAAPVGKTAAFQPVDVQGKPYPYPLKAKADGKPWVIRYVFKWANTTPPAITPIIVNHAKSINVDYLYTGPQTSDVALQVAMIEDMVSAKVDVLIVSSLGPAVCNAVDEAIDAGIKVLMADGDCPTSKRKHFIGSDNISLGRDAATKFAEAVKGKGKQKILVITGTPGAPNLQEREKGFKDQLKALGVDAEYLPTVPCYEDPQKAIDGVESSLRGDPTITGLYSCAWWPFDTEAANLPVMVDRVKNKGLTVVSVDARAAALKLVDQGYIYALIAQNQGQNRIGPLDLAYQWGVLGVQDYPMINTVPSQIVTKDGGPGMFKATEFSKMLYTDYDWDMHTITPADFKPTAAASKTAAFQPVDVQGKPYPYPLKAKADGKPWMIRYVFKWANTTPPAITPIIVNHAKSINVDYLYTGPQTSDVALQVAMIEDMVSAKVDVLIVSSLGPAVCNAVDEAIDAGIKVLMADGDCPTSKRKHFIGSDNISLGRDAATKFAEAVKGKGKQKILVITGTPGAPNLQEREKGFKDQLKALGVDAEYLPTVPCYEDPQKAIDGVESSLRGDPTITGLYSCAWWPFDTEAANLPVMVDRVKNKGLTVVSVDARAAALKLVDQGYIYALIAQNQGQNRIGPLDLAYQWGVLGVQDYPMINTVPSQIVTKDGGPGMFKATEFSKMLYTDYDWDMHTITPADFKK